MNISYKKTGAIVLSSGVFLLPVLALAQVGIPCEGPDCDFNDLVVLVNNVIKFLLYKVAVPLTALGFMVAGGKLIYSQNKEGAWTEAKESFELMGYGFLIMLGAYVLIKFVLFQFLTVKDPTFTQFMQSLFE